jgi:hypothetical protein
MAKLKTMMLTTKTVMTTTMIMTMRTWLDALLEGGNRFDNDSLEEGGGRREVREGSLFLHNNQKMQWPPPPAICINMLQTLLHKYLAIPAI